MSILQTCDSLKAKFALARCWPDADGRIYVRYATGYTEYLTVSQAEALLAQPT